MRTVPLLVTGSLLCGLIVVACSTQPTPPSGCSKEAACPPNAVCREGVCVPVETDTDAGADAGDPDGGDDAGLDAGEEDAGLDAGADDAGEDGGADGGEDAGEVDAGCVFDAGNPPNLLPNPGFECGLTEPEGWVPVGAATLSLDTSTVNSGAQAAKLTATSGSTAMNLYPVNDSPTDGGTDRYCASAYVTGTVGRTARVSLRTLSAGGFVDNSFSAPITASWQRLDVAASTTAANDAVTVRIWMPNPTTGDELLIDDAQLWVSPGGNCTER